MVGGTGQDTLNSLGDTLKVIHLWVPDHMNLKRADELSTRSSVPRCPSVGIACDLVLTVKGGIHPLHLTAADFREPRFTIRATSMSIYPYRQMHINAYMVTAVCTKY